MRLGPQFQKPDLSREPHTLGYIQRPWRNLHVPVPMPSDPHRAPRMTLSMWPTQRGQK